MSINHRQRLIAEPLLLFLVMFLPGYLLGGGFEAGSIADIRTLYIVAVTALPQILLVVFLIAREPAALPGFGITVLRLWHVPAALGVAAGMALVLIPVAYLSAAAGAAPNEFLQAAGGAQITLTVASVVVVSSLLTGYREELFFRAFLHGRLLEAEIPIVPAALASILLFGAGHIYQGFVAFLESILLASILTIVFRRYRSLHVIAIAHGFYNSAVLLLAFSRSV